MTGKFKPIKIPDPSDLIIEQMLNLLRNNQLQPGEQLPSEPVLQSAFSVTRQQLKSAFKRLELYGVLETRPQAGNYLAAINKKILMGLIANILGAKDKANIGSLTETRLILEVSAAEWACRSINDQDLRGLEKANQAFLYEVKRGQRAIELDLFFHMEIVRLSRNPTLISLYSFITRDLIDFWHKFDSQEKSLLQKRLHDTEKEHLAILEGFKTKIPAQAGQAVKNHLKKVISEVYSILRD